MVQDVADKMKKTNLTVLCAVRASTVIGAVLMVPGCSGLASAPELDKIAAQTLSASFRDQGVAKVDRLVQDDANRECSAADTAGKPIDAQIGQRIEAASLKSVKAPSDGKFLGDWKAGEAIAQNGRGLTWSDAAGSANGGNCYNCHRISNAEVSYGTIGPSLYNYGKIRGVSNPDSAQSKAIVDYTWGKLWNARAYNACSGMPRFGHSQILGEKQLKDLMALLLDPASPVNQ